MMSPKKLTPPLALAQNFTGVALCLLALAGCSVTGSPDWDARFGDRVKVLNAQQLVDPAATARNGQVNPPSEGRTVREAIERHVDGYRTPPQSSVVGGAR